MFDKSDGISNWLNMNTMDHDIALDLRSLIRWTTAIVGSDPCDLCHPISDGIHIIILANI